MNVISCNLLWEERYSTNQTRQPNATNEVAECSTYVHQEHCHSYGHGLGDLERVLDFVDQRLEEG